MQVLKAVGLKTEVDKETFVRIAERIEADWDASASGQDAAAKDEVWGTAMEAAKYFKEFSTSLHGDELYRQLQGIAFMPATQVQLA